MVGETAGYANPKLRNVAKAYRASVHDIILFLDDSVELDSALFAELLRSLEPGVVAVTAAPRGDDAENFFAEIEAATATGIYFGSRCCSKFLGSLPLSAMRSRFASVILRLSAGSTD